MSVQLKAAWKSPIFSPSGLIVRAMLVLFVFVVVSLLGFRAHTTLLSGTMPELFGSVEAGIFAGGVYMLFYFASVLMVPIAVIAAVFMALARRFGLYEN